MDKSFHENFSHYEATCKANSHLDGQPMQVNSHLDSGRRVFKPGPDRPNPGFGFGKRQTRVRVSGLQYSH